MHTNEQTPKMNESATLPPPLWEGRPPLERAILSCLMDGAEWTVADFVEECGRSDRYVSIALRELEAWGMVARRVGAYRVGQGRPADLWRMEDSGWPR